MEDLQAQLDEVTTALDETSSSLSDTADTVAGHDDTLADHDTRINDTEQKAGQLDFPLTQDSIDRIKEVFVTGNVTLVAGTATVNIPQISVNSIVLYSVKTFAGLTLTYAGNPTEQYSYTLATGSVTFTSLYNADVSTLTYVIF